VTSAVPPASVPALASAAASTTQPAAHVPGGGGIKFSASPRNGQTLDQQARDQYDCYRFGVAQTGFDPMTSGTPAAGKPNQADFDRARAACFEGRGYAVR